MSRLKPVRTSLEVGFDSNGPTGQLLGLRGREYRAIGPVEEFPFEDAQFEVVMLAASVVNRQSVREAYRVLRSEGWLYFSVPEKNSRQVGMTLPEIYSIVREGFNILEVERPAWWHFRRVGRLLTICAQKKSWRAHTNTYRPLV